MDTTATTPGIQPPYQHDVIPPYQPGVQMCSQIPQFVSTNIQNEQLPDIQQGAVGSLHQLGGSDNIHQQHGMDTATTAPPSQGTNKVSNRDTASGQAHGQAYGPSTQDATVNRNSDKPGKRCHSENTSDTPAKKQSNSVQHIFTVPVSNRYAPLENDSDQGNRFNYVDLTTSQEDVTVKIPPIYVKDITNISQFNNEIKKHITDQFTSEMSNNKIKIKFNYIVDYRKTIKYLLSTNRQFHTYRDPANKKFSVVFKNIHPSISQQEIYEFLIIKFPSLISVTRLYKDSVPIPVVAAEFDGQQSIDEVLEIKQICNLCVKTEKRRKAKGPIQCMRCLDFGHTRNSCNYTIACSFCAQDHYTVNCPHKNQTPVCKNCQGPHRADIRSGECSYYKKITEISNNPKPVSSKTMSKTTSSPKLNPLNFPSLPSNRNIPNFTYQENPTNSPTNQHNNQSTPTNVNINPNINNTNPILHTIVNTITNYIIDIVNSIIPSIINNIQNSITIYFRNNYGTPAAK